MNDRSENAFRTTHWTQVLAAIGESTEAKQAQRDLCEVYYGPVEAFVRRYRAGRDDARDLTHEFFAKLLKGNSLKGVERTRGRFRSYLLGAVKHFLSDQADRALAEKRGSGQLPQSLDASPGHDHSERQEHAPLDVADPHGFPPDAYFDRQWALAIVEKAMSVLQADSQDGGETQRFNVLRRWLIPSEDDAIAAEAARSLDMTDGAFKVAVHRLRKRFRQLVKDQIASSVDGPEAIQAELDYLILALTTSESCPAPAPATRMRCQRWTASATVPNYQSSIDLLSSTRRRDMASPLATPWQKSSVAVVSPRLFSKNGKPIEPPHADHLEVDWVVRSLFHRVPSVSMQILFRRGSRAGGSSAKGWHPICELVKRGCIRQQVLQIHQSLFATAGANTHNGIF